VSLKKVKFGKFGVKKANLATLLCGAPDYIGAHRIKHAHNFYFILFVCSGLGMCNRWNSLVCNDKLNSHWRLRHSGVIGKELNTGWLI